MSQAHEAAIERINQASAERTERTIVSPARKESIDIAYEAIGLRLSLDEEAMLQLEAEGYPEGETVGIFVTEDSLTRDSLSNERIRSYGILLVDAALYEAVEEARDQGDDVTDLVFDDDIETYVGNIGGAQFSRLEVSIPIDDHTFIEDFTMPPRDFVKEIHLSFSVVGDDETPVEYWVREDAMIEDIPDDAVQGASPLIIPDIMRRTGTSISEESITAVEALRSIVNMRTVPRRYIDTSEADVKDF